MLRLLRRLQHSLCCEQPDTKSESDVMSLESVCVNVSAVAQPDHPLLPADQRPVGCVAPVPRVLDVPARRREDLLETVTLTQADLARADTLTAALFNPRPGLGEQGGWALAVPELTQGQRGEIMASLGLPGVDVSVLEVAGFAQRTLSTARRMLELQVRAAEGEDVTEEDVFFDWGLIARGIGSVQLEREWRAALIVVEEIGGAVTGNIEDDGDVLREGGRGGGERQPLRPDSRPR